MSEPLAPDSLVELGVVLGAHGVRGALRVRTPSGRDSILPQLSRVTLRRSGEAESTHDMAAARWQGQAWLVTLKGIEQREEAAAMRGTSVCAPRSAFPKTAENEFYWVDLLGCKVLNRHDACLGEVVSVDEHGAAPFIAVRGDGGPQHLIPLVPDYLLNIDLPARVVRVDWEADWT